jgi:hypothetical protein
MAIEDINALQQALANIRLESLELSENMQHLLQLALLEGTLDTQDLINAVLDA